MKPFAKCILLLVIFLGSPGIAKSQEYLYEIGPTVGASFYSGDANNYALLQKPQSVFGISLRRNFNFRTALKVDLLKAEVAADTRDVSNFRPVLPDVGYLDFKTGFYDVNAHLEYSFFSYSDSFEYKETHRFSPYIFAGAGVTFIPDSSNKTKVNIPIGLGVKYKLFHRWNVGLEYSMNMLLSDKLEQFEDKYNIETQSALKNKDWYSYLKFYITFDFIERSCKCNKQK